MNDNWSDEGLCRNKIINNWFPIRTNSPSIDKAKAVCRECPVQAQCLEYGLEERLGNGTPLVGIWGGTTDDERVKIRALLGGRTYAEVRAEIA